VVLCETSASLCVIICDTETHGGFTEEHREKITMELNKITEKIIGCAIEVHKLPGPGLLESAYEECLTYELTKAGLKNVLQSGFKVSVAKHTSNDHFRN
jgi:hypothetical protein